MGTRETAALLEVWFAPHSPACRTIEYHCWERHGDSQACLLPSGHVLGDAMLYVNTPDGSVLYAGDVRLGAIDARFLDAPSAAAAVDEVCVRYREQRRTPVLVTLSNCGKAQDAVAALWAADLVPALQTDDGMHYDATVAWSDHASRRELLEIVHAVALREVWTFAGTGQLAGELRGMGFTARHLPSARRDS